MTKDAIRKYLKLMFGKSSMEICILWPKLFVITAMKKLNGIQLRPEELNAIIATVKQKRPCNFLIFGLGNDSVLWTKMNAYGKTIFIEDNKGWYNENAAQQNLKAFLVDYCTKMAQWQDLIEYPDLLDMSLPDDIKNEKWDIILIDGPAGWNETNPGRMKSIFLATKLIKRNGDVFVHDCDRQIERIYCDRFFSEENLMEEINLLRHYNMAS